MMTLGFVPAYGDVATEGVSFISDGILCVSYYINIGGAGNLVWLNQYGNPQYSENLNAGQEYVIAATQILASATVNGTARTTTATNVSWRGAALNNTP